MKSRLLVLVGAIGAFGTACSEDALPPDGSGGSAGGAGLGGGGASGAAGNGGTSATGGSAGTGGGGVGGTAGLGGTGGGAGVGGSAGGAAGSAGSSAGTENGAAGGMAGASGSNTGGASGGGAAGTSGGAGTSGAGGAAGGGAAGASGSAGAAGSGGAIPLGNPPVESEGCGSPTTIETGKYTIQSSGDQRSYIIDIPDDYDMNTPHRVFYTSHWINSTSEAVRDQDYYFLKPLAEADDVPVIFVAPQSDDGTWDQIDHALFDDLLAHVKENLCIDTTRVFATGFSFGGMITYSLSTNHQKDIRAAVGIAPANYNIWLPQKTGEPIAWMQTTGMGDNTCPWVNNEQQRRGAKFIALEHAENNGCTIPNDIPTVQGDHLCYDFEGCPAEYPVKACTFDGGHTNIDNESGMNWIATESWDFFMQF
jgi:poly(3-hydroxybutyrate) depolymerase